MLAGNRGYRREPFPFQAGVEVEFEAALASAARRSAQATLDLEHATRVCVRELKSEGVTPEGVIITMRAYVRHLLTTRIFQKRPDDLHNLLESVCDRLAGWCVDEYFPRHDDRGGSIGGRP